MTTYKFNLKDNNNNSSYSSSNSSYLKSLIADKLANKYSWFNDSPSKIYVTTKPSPKTIYIETPSYYNFDTDYAKAIAILDNYAAKKYNKAYLSFSNYIDEYDFEIDGTPIRIFDDMIQIGNHMFAKNASSSYYASLNPSLKKTIIDITIKINK